MLFKGEYSIDADHVLGRGSFGTVHVATSKEGDTVAAKRIDTRRQDKLAELAQGLEKLVKLEHENIARVYDFCHEAKVLWVFIEYCDQGDLMEYVRNRGPACPLGDTEKLKLMLDISKGLQYLHSKNVIHRDIKPSNILLKGPAPLTAKFTDFDCSKFLDDFFTTSLMTTSVGTRAFKAPEFFSRTVGGKVNYHRNVDVFALGLTFLAMIQNNECLIPKIETPKDPSELQIEIGVLLWERQKYKVEPLQVVQIQGRPPAGQNPLWVSMRSLIGKMTHVDPTQRISADHVVHEMLKITCPDVVAGARADRDADADHFRACSGVCAQCLR